MTGEGPKNVSASARQRLLNLAHERKDEFQLVLIRYGVERLLYRLSVTPHTRQFVLKGAMLFQLWTGQPHRSTLDVDLLGFGDDDVSRLVKVLTEVCSQDVPDDGLIFLPESVKGSVIRENQRYGGVRIRMTALLDNARIPLQIDIGFGDVITPKVEWVEYPTLLGQPAPFLRAYPKETVVAEKYEAMVNLGIANSRMKDFYDLWVLAGRFEFEGVILAKAMRATFERRKTEFPTAVPVALTVEFAKDKAKQALWSAFVRRGRLVEAAPDFHGIVEFLHSFLWPVTAALIGGQSFATQWTASGPWR